MKRSQRQSSHAPETTLLPEALAVLTRPEWREWLDFVRSPYFNKKDFLIRLAEYAFACVEAGRPFDRKAAFAVAHGPDVPFDEAKIRLAMSRLLTLLEEFWVIRDTVGDDFSIRQRTPGAYRRRNLPRHFVRTLREAHADLDRQTRRDAAYFDDLLLLETESYEWNALQKRTESLNLQEISDLLDAGFAAKKLRHACFSLAHQAVFRADYRFGFLDAVLEKLSGEAAELLQHPAVALYFHCYRFLTLSDGEADFRAFRAALERDENRFPETEIRGLYRLALNFCIKKINASETVFYDEAMRLYRAALDKGYLLENGVLSRFSYNNVVVLALKINDLEWAEAFIHQFKPKVERAHREALFAFNLARVEYLRKNYKAALLQLQKADYKDLIHNLSAKTLQMKIFYELGETDLLDAHLDSMKTFLRRHRDMTYHRENFKNTIRLTRQLTQLPPGDLAARTQLRQAISETPGLAEREWLLEMAEEAG